MLLVTELYSMVSKQTNFVYSILAKFVYTWTSMWALKIFKFYSMAVSTFVNIQINLFPIKQKKTFSIW
jgi:hypothetical protein